MLFGHAAGFLRVSAAGERLVRNSSEEVFSFRPGCFQTENHIAVRAHGGLGTGPAAADALRDPAAPHRLHDGEHQQHGLGADPAALGVHRAAIATGADAASLFAVPAAPLRRIPGGSRSPQSSTRVLPHAIWEIFLQIICSNTPGCQSPAASYSPLGTGDGGGGRTSAGARR